MRRALPAVLLLAAACSQKAALNYKHCLKLRVGMTRADMIAVMGRPEETIPYVEGKSLPHLKGRTAYEWPNPATMPGPDHVSVADATGRVESIRCANVDITAALYVEPPAPSGGAAAPAPAAQAPPPSAAAATLDEAIALYRRKELRAALKAAWPLAQKNDPDAQFFVGLIYLSGDDVGLKNDVNEALKWLYQAKAKNGEAAALYAATLMDNNGSPAAVARETAWAASLGSPAGLLLRGNLLLSGDRDQLAPDAAEGEKFLVRAAQAGSPAAQQRLGALAQAARKDLLEAYRWTLAAARHPVVGKFDDPLHAVSNAWSPADQAAAKEKLKELEASMNSDQLSEARTRVGR